MPGVGLQVALAELVERPAPELDAALDAFALCLARHGLRHTSVRDVALELGVSKATVYRQLGSVNDAIRLVLAREVHELFEALDAALATRSGPDAVVVMAVTVTRHTLDHPLARKLLADEPHLVGELLHYVPMAIVGAASVLRSYLAASMGSGEIRTGDPDALAELIVRLAAIAVFAPPPDLDAYFRSALLPHLEPA